MFALAVLAIISSMLVEFPYNPHYQPLILTACDWSHYTDTPICDRVLTSSKRETLPQSSKVYSFDEIFGLETQVSCLNNFACYFLFPRDCTISQVVNWEAIRQDYIADHVSIHTQYLIPCLKLTKWFMYG